MGWFKKDTEKPQGKPSLPAGIFSTDLDLLSDDQHKKSKQAVLQGIFQSQPVIAANTAMDSALKENFTSYGSQVGVPDAQFYWYASQGFIGHQVNAIIAQHWLVDKACSMPARDAVRQGYELTVNGGEGVESGLLDKIKNADKAYKINQVMQEYIRFGRVFGVRVAIFKVQSTDPEYYEKPFNIDGVTKNSYQGISQVDPIWCQPILTGASLSDPASMRFYDPEFWLIGGKKYHKSHLSVYVPYPVSDLLKPSYNYGGVSLPQRIYERVYAAERTANEAPQLAMTKRLTVLKVNATAFFANIEKAKDNLLTWIGLRDNYGVKVIDKEAEDISQHDTSLADLDATIMTQYQLVASIANVPATKILGTTPKGFNSTGEYEEASYREELESIQENDLNPLLDKHHQILIRSMGIDDVTVTTQWSPLDSPTAQEWADIDLKKAQAAQAYQASGAVDGIDIRKQLITDKDGMFYGLPDVDYPDDTEPDDEDTPTVNE